MDVSFCLQVDGLITGARGDGEGDYKWGLRDGLEAKVYGMICVSSSVPIIFPG